MDGKKRTGVVSFWTEDRGFGFIEHDQDKDDIFVHYSGILGNGRRSLRKGQGVRFEIGEGRKGRPCAINVELLST